MGVKSSLASVAIVKAFRRGDFVSVVMVKMQNQRSWRCRNQPLGMDEQKPGPAERPAGIGREQHLKSSFRLAAGINGVGLSTDLLTLE